MFAVFTIYYKACEFIYYYCDVTRIYYTHFMSLNVIVVSLQVEK